MTGKSDVIIAFIENLLNAMRTAGALMIGNSLLVFFKVLGGSGFNIDIVFFGGIIIATIGSIPVATLAKKFKEKING